MVKTWGCKRRSINRVSLSYLRTCSHMACPQSSSPVCMRLTCDGTYVCLEMATLIERCITNFRFIWSCMGEHVFLQIAMLNEGCITNFTFKRSFVRVYAYVSVQTSTHTEPLITHGQINGKWKVLPATTKVSPLALQSNDLTA